MTATMTKADPKHFDRLLGAAVAAEMVKRAVKGNDLAPKVGLKPPALSERLNGKTSFKASELARVALALGCSVETFYEWASQAVSVGYLEWLADLPFPDLQVVGE